MKLVLAALCVAAWWILFLLNRTAQSSSNGHENQEEKQLVSLVRQAVSIVEEEEEEDRSSLVHVVFSTDCSPYQDWQSEVVFHSAHIVGHKGPLTRIASGCSPADIERINERYETLYDDSRQIFVHFTPEFDKDEVTGKTYHFFNKPRGIEHWLASPSSSSSLTDVVALVDPDFAFLRPLTDTFEKSETLVIPPWTFDQIPRRVERGTPFGQQYGLGTHWLTFDRAAVCGERSRCVQTSQKDAYKYYPVGPPYIMHIDDWRRLAPVWSEFAPRVYKQYPNLLAEMYAYCMAAAHLDLKHVRVNHLMLSNADVKDEGWALVDGISLDAACPSSDRDSPRLVAEKNVPLPAFLHFCQNYRLGEWMFAKRRVPKNIMSDCDQELLAVPTGDISSLRYELQPPGNPCKQEPKRKCIVSATSIKLCNRQRSSQCETRQQDSLRHVPRDLARERRRTVSRARFEKEPLVHVPFPGTHERLFARRIAHQQFGAFEFSPQKKISP